MYATKNSQPQMGHEVWCHRCDLKWSYVGPRQRYVTCLRCKTAVSVKGSDARLAGDPVAVGRHAYVRGKRPAASGPREVVCHRCSHRWVYRGSMQFVVSCPSKGCGTTVTLQQSDARLAEERLKEQTVPVAAMQVAPIVDAVRAVA